MNRKSLIVLDVVGLTPRLLEHMPRLSVLARIGFRAELETVFPAVTCSVQSSFLTGLTPSEHGIVGNGWYFRDLGEVYFWRQHNALVRGEKMWEAARRTFPDYKAANLCWWYAMGATTDITLTPRPVYHADGRKSPDCYAFPGSLHERLTADLGRFPLFQYWGPGASIASSEWIAAAAEKVLVEDDPDLTLVYLPHLDYDLQRFGPDSPQAVAAAREIDRVAGRLGDFALERDRTVVVLSEYGITAAGRHVDVNRHLRRAGLLNVYTQDGMEYLDPWTSGAFAVADHQVAHVYVRDPGMVSKVKALIESVGGVDVVLDEEGKKAARLNHERAGELVAVAEPGAWFTHYYWLEDDRAPDFARTVEIHRKPGFDPAELFLDPDDRWVKARATLALGRKRLGFRYVMDVVPLDPTHVRGTHGRLPENPQDGPILLRCEPGPRPHCRDRCSAVTIDPGGRNDMTHKRRTSTESSERGEEREAAEARAWKDDGQSGGSERRSSVRRKEEGMFGPRVMSRVLTLVVCAMTVVFVAACGGGSQGGGGGGGGSEGPFTIGISNGFISSEWRTQMIDDLQTVNDEYKKEGLTEDLVIESADVDPQGQIQQMRNLLNRGVDAIIVNPNDATALDQVIGQAEQAGIPVVAVDQEIAAPGVTNVVIDQGEWASMGAEWLVEELGGEGSVVVINGIAGHPANEARYDAVKEVFADNPGIEVVQEANADWDQATAQQEMSNIIASQPNIDGIWTQDGMARGVLQAVQADNPAQYPVISGEARSGYMRLWEETRQQNPDFASYGPINPPGVGASGLRVAVELLQGKEIKQSELQGEAGNTLYVPIPGVVTNQNLEEELQKIDIEGEYVLDGIISRKQAQAFFE